MNQFLELARPATLFHGTIISGKMSSKHTRDYIIALLVISRQKFSLIAASTADIALRGKKQVFGLR